MNTPARRMIPAWIVFFLTVVFHAGLTVAETLPRPYSPCRCNGKRMEMALVVDTTGSMSKMLNTCKAQAEKIMRAAAMRHSVFKLGIVAFRTMDDPEYTTVVHDLSDDLVGVGAFFQKLEPKGGGAEVTDVGLLRAVTELSWSQGARKVILVIGDEQPNPNRRNALFNAARIAKEKGIIIHTLTASQTAWNYWSQLNPESARKYLALNGKDAIRDFVLPDYLELSKITGGLSRGSWEAGDIVRWFLAVALSRETDADALNMTAFDTWRPPKKPDETKLPVISRATGAAAAGSALQPDPNTPQAATIIAELRDSHAWNARNNYAAMFDFLSEQLVVQRPDFIPVMIPGKTDLSGAGILYLAAARAPEFSTEQIDALAAYVNAGGVIWADGCCCALDFNRSIPALAVRITGNQLNAVNVGHPLYTSAYDLREPATRYGTGSGALVMMARPSPADSDTPGAVMFTPWDIGSAWDDNGIEPRRPIDRTLALKLNTNIIAWALMRKDD